MQDVTRARINGPVQQGNSLGVADAFTEVISTWDEQLCCRTKQTARPCRNPAAWVSLTPCHRGRVVCTFHKNRYVRKTLRSLAVSPRLLLECCYCGGSLPFEHFVGFRRV